MANAPANEGAFDRSEYERAAAHFRIVQKELSPDAVTGLAQEVVNRLAFRVKQMDQIDGFPSRHEIEKLCAALLSSDETAGERMILEARRDGADMNRIYLGYVAGAARRLGVMWEDDLLSFVDVSVGCARLYRIIRGLRHVIASGITHGREERSALFALVPQETHTLGIEMATDLFRREGWEIDLELGLSHEELIGRSEVRNYQAIVLVANSQQMLGALTRLIVGLRITQPLSHIFVAGKILQQYPKVAQITGVDGVMPDLETAVATLRDIMAGESLS